MPLPPPTPASPAGDADYQAFSRKVKQLTGIDLAGYKRDQMQRRLLTLAQRNGANTLAKFADLMQSDPKAMAAFKDFFTINVSELLRDPARWMELEKKVLPALLREAGNRPLKIWSAGCSYGAEAYSLALLLDEAPGRPAYVLHGTDIDETILARAQRGAGFSENDMRNVSPARREKYFAKQADGTYNARETLKGKMRFRRQDLLRETPDRDFDLIVCRNVVIYFTDEAKRALYQRFVHALRPGGVLFVGGTEMIGEARAMGLTLMTTSFYHTAPAAAVRAA